MPSLLVKLIRNSDIAAMASSSSTVASLEQKLDVHDGAISVSGQPFVLFFKGTTVATLDHEGLRSSPDVEAVIEAPSGPIVKEIASSLIPPGIPERLVADYRALRNGLAAALELKISQVQAVGDCKLLQDQMTGAVKIYSSTVRKLASEVMDQINQLEVFELVILPRMEGHLTAWDLASEYWRQSDKSAENSGGKMIAMEPSTDLCMSISSQAEEKSRVNSHKKMMVMDATTQGCSSAFPNEEIVVVSQPAIDQRCNICLEDKTHKEMITINGCLHTFCAICVKKHTQSELKGGRIARCPQPECRREMEEEQCGQFLSPKLLELFTRLLAEASIPEHERIYCPYADCSKLFLKTVSQSSSEDFRMVCNQATCVACNRSLCLSCKVPSHAPLTCAEYGELPPEEKQEHDLKLLELSTLCQWKRCGACHMIIEKTEGCAHMVCRCGYEFCYTCQAKWRTCGCQ